MRLIDRIFDVEIDLGKVKITVFDLLFALILSAMGLMFRFYLFDVKSGDYVTAFADWMKECHQAGGFAYLGIKPGVSDASTFDYNCMFQYLIVLLHYIGGGGAVNDMYLVKMMSVVFDYICAFTVMRITYLATGQNVRKAFFAYAAVMFLPTVVLNSAAWAQNDSIYTTFILLSLLHFMKGNDLRAFIYLAVSYSFKQQALFFFPFVIIMWFKNKIKIRYALSIPIFYVVSMIPSAIAGREWADLLGIYGNQVSMFSRLSMNYPSIYTIIASDLDKSIRKMIIPAGTVCTAMIFGVLAYYIYRKNFEITYKYMITLVIFTAELCCFCLPVMHERYGYIPELLAVVYALFSYKRMPICALLQVISMITYSRFLFGSTVTYLWPLSVTMLAIILVIGYDLYKQMADGALVAQEIEAGQDKENSDEPDDES